MGTNRNCAKCNNPVDRDSYPKYRVILANDNDKTANQHTEEQLCPECWSLMKARIEPTQQINESASAE